MKKGKLFGIGVGPGDPDLLTIKAVKTLNEVDIIICPEKKEAAGSFAYDIAKKHIKEDAILLHLTFPMIYNEDELKIKWKENAEKIAEKIKKGKTLAFITLGDPTVYSTYMYLLPYLKELEVEVETIPGITSFCLLAGSMNLPIAEWEESFCIVPLRKGEDDKLSKALDDFDNVIVMKPSNNCRMVADELIKRGLQNNFVLISKVGTENQNVVTDIDVIKNEKIPYLSTIIIKKKGIKL
ncbi:precorrin-2 C(20)-methyltransferase [Clostridium sediminicola]|uniref:precorrin-2 C(20)-methyltransferase n=1 Tax=Clostridium sediminicola TaxID=3114879 RepID=UPI0031F271A2